MAKLNKMYYYTSKGEKKLNCYNIAIPKELVHKTRLEDKEIQLEIKNNTIVLKKLDK